MSKQQSLTTPWDPLSEEVDQEIYGATLKREIKNIIKSYTGWFDPLSELIQNALDAVDERKRIEKDFLPKLWIEINLKDNYVCVTDNGIGFTETQFRSFLRPNVSFKGGGTRGDKGVGVTYLAYGFNSLQLGTKTSDFSYVGDIKGGREWVEDEKNIKPRPTVRASTPIHSAFGGIDRGSTFCLRLTGDYIRPSNLTWSGAETCDQWETILRIKTPLGGTYLDRPKTETVCVLKVVNTGGTYQEKTVKNCEYYYPHTVVSTCVDLRDIIRTQTELTAKGKSVTKLPEHFYKLNGIYSFWSNADLVSGKGLPLNLKDPEKELIKKYGISAYGFFTYTVDVWDEFNDNIVKLRKGMRIMRGGLQLATNGMPQGELILIPLTRNIGYQHNSHVLVHFALAEPDLGRKGFQPELEELAERIAVSIVELLLDWKSHLKSTTGVTPQITQDKEIHTWKSEMEQHEKTSPLIINRKDIFLPTNEVALTATPMVEQDVVSLFNQLLAGGVIRGIKLMSASQHKQYDGLWKGYMKKPFEHYLFDKGKNPLGVDQATPTEFESPPYVLEYKYNFDALLEEIEQGEKDPSAIGLVVCWEMGDSWKKKYSVTPLLHFSNLQHRDVHGVTHLIQDAATGKYTIRAVILKELIEFLNDPDGVQDYQKQKYMED
ncbi:MAG: ATP-binding protein [Candidatus Bathyarchaeia archaeon]